ncbi:MAG: transposase [Planctomycetaceae bacterium]
MFMPRPNRHAPGGLPFHVLNRSVGRRTLFHSGADYVAFIDTVAETLRTRPMRICSYCVMPNHWHMVLWPECDGHLSAFVQHFTNLHVKRWKRVHGEVGLGHLYQGRFKSFPIQSDAYFHAVVRYVERNPLRANLVERAEDWPWSSLGQRSGSAPIPIASWPVPHTADREGSEWLEWVNRPQTEAELERLRSCAIRGKPFGDEGWVDEVAARLYLTATLRPRGRPRADGVESASG